jgi:hypothetical protein
LKNINGLTVAERIMKDIEFAEASMSEDQRSLLIHIAIGAAELAIEYGLITYEEWDVLTKRAFSAI